jgi:hypothetical protein
MNHNWNFTYCFCLPSFEVHACSDPHTGAVFFYTLHVSHKMGEETTAWWKLNPRRLLKLWKRNGSISAVSNLILQANRKYSLGSSWRDLQHDLRSFAPLRPQRLKFIQHIFVTSFGAFFHTFSNDILTFLQFSFRFMLKLHYILSEIQRLSR